MAFKEHKISILLEKVYQLIQERLDEPQAAQVEKFARLFFQHVELDDLYLRDDASLYGMILCLWHQLSGVQTKVKVYNPEQQKHGWQSTHTIIQVTQKDMPFIVDSMEMLLKRFETVVHFIRNMPILIERDAQGKITSIGTVSSQTGEKNQATSVLYIEVSRQNNPSIREQIKQEIQQLMAEVTTVVDSWQPILKAVETSSQGLKKVGQGNQSYEDAVNFLNYLRQNRFTFLGYCYFDLTGEGENRVLEPNPNSALGLYQTADFAPKPFELRTLPEYTRQVTLKNSLMVLTKNQAKSRIHRADYIDHIGVKRFNAKGEVVGEDRFLGLYGLAMYHSSAMEIPLLSSKVTRILESSGLQNQSHDYKQLLHILETYPREELLQAKEDELAEITQGVLQIRDRDRVKVFIRQDSFSRYISCMVYVAKERFNTRLRKDTQAFLAQYFNSHAPVEFMTYFTQSTLARTHYTVKVDHYNVEIDVKDIENNLKELTRLWEDKFNHALISHFGEARGREISSCYSSAFPRSYQEEVSATTAIYDIEQLESLTDDKSLGILFYRPPEADARSGHVRLKLYNKNDPITLSDMLPMLENFGLRVINEHPYEVKATHGNFWISDFMMLIQDITAEELAERQELFQEALLQVWQGDIEDDGFNRLVLKTGTSGRETSIIRSFAKYMRQIETTFSQSYIVETMAKHGKCARLLIDLFERKFNPKLKDRSLTKLADKIEVLLDDVTSLDDDRIIRRYLDLIYATLRTNYYQKNSDGQNKPYISLKFSPELIPDMPLPLPKYEIFVYAVRFEGVHLRGGKVARGGLRWSDRPQDFRTEVLGLVKAQQVKNTVIVPVGAKGGFVCKQLSSATSREDFLKEGQACYRLFIRALLDITDNIVQGEVKPPIDVVSHDEEDPYLVVAADKGTATFSDIANSISDEYNFWLGDAFASGGSNGYDHKKMGITAKGAWESVMRHFKEFGVNCQASDFSCIGVGDMAGDVFGNGMLLSKHILLKAAFNHIHIFLDPSPDAAKSWDERQRLFTTPGTSWTDYNKNLISKGGGVFLRSAKSIRLTPEIKTMLGATKDSLTPNALIQHILKMKVDLLWNGGIGTYVKSSKETHLDVGDRTNDAVRVNANELQVKIIGEGGNLGLTQLARVEFDIHQGRVNTDFIDNVGGVDCSDNEVNIKILLNGLVAAGELTLKQRNTLLEDMTQEVSDIVLSDCRHQTQAISISESFGASQLKEHTRFIQHLEKEGKLDRLLEFLPPDEELAERIAAGKSLTRPEISVLFSYAKMVLKEQLNTPEVTQNPYLIENLLIQYFPNRLQDKYHQQITEHPLSSEIIATSLANQIVNDMGMNFMYRMHEETGAPMSEIGICYLIARSIFSIPEMIATLTSSESEVTSEMQYEVLYKLRRNTRRACYWLIRHRDRQLKIADVIEKYSTTFHVLKKDITSWLMDEEVRAIAEVVYKYEQAGVMQEIAFTVANMGRLFSSLDVTEISLQARKPILPVAELYFKLRARCQLYWFLEQINAQRVNNHWQALARSAFREELDAHQRKLTLTALALAVDSGKVDETLEQWTEDNHQPLSRWFHMLADFKISTTHEFAKFSVLLRELSVLVMNIKNTL